MIEIKPRFKIFIWSILKNYTINILLFGFLFIWVSKDFFLNNLLKEDDFKYFEDIPFIIAALFIFLVVFPFIGFIIKYIYYWQINTDGIIIKRFYLKDKFIEWNQISGISGDDGKLTILLSNWKSKNSMVYIDFITFKKIQKLFCQNKYNMCAEQKFELDRAGVPRDFKDTV